MHRKFFLFIVVIFCSVSAHAQSKSDVFNPDSQITWLGLDFTGAKFIGDRERLGSESDIRHLLDALNDLMVKESEKFNVATALKRKNVEISVDVTKEHNAELDILSLISASANEHIHLNPEAVEQIVRSYDFKGKSGIGVMFNVESFNKIMEEGSFWITFVNMNTKEILFAERLTAPPAGFGMRNFWAGAVNGVLAKIRKKEFDNWKSKHS